MVKHNHRSPGYAFNKDSTRSPKPRNPKYCVTDCEVNCSRTDNRSHIMTLITFESRRSPYITQMRPVLKANKEHP